MALTSSSPFPSAAEPPLAARFYSAALDEQSESVAHQWMMTAYPKNEYAIFYRLEPDLLVTPGQILPRPTVYTTTRFIVAFNDVRDPQEDGVAAMPRGGRGDGGGGRRNGGLKDSGARPSRFKDEALELDSEDDEDDEQYLDCPRFREDLNGRWYKVGSLTVERKSMLDLITTIGELAPKGDMDWTERVVLPPVDVRRAERMDLPSVPPPEEDISQVRNWR